MISHNERTERKKILVMTSTFPRWKGDHAPNFVFELCLHLSSDFEITVLAPHAPGASTDEIIDGIRVARFRYFFEWGESLAYNGGILPNLRSNPLRYAIVPGFLLLQLIALIRLLKQENYSAIHAHWLVPQGFIATISRYVLTQRPPLLITIHGSDLHALRGSLFSSLQRFVINRCDILATVSSAMKNRAMDLGAKPEATVIASMGIDSTSTFSPSKSISRNTHELLYVGRLSEGKGLGQLIRAVPTVLSSYPDCKLSIVGHGPELDRLQSLTRELGISGNIEFLGPLSHSDLAKIYQRACLLVFPSISDEGFGLVCIEAMACECPVIAAELPATKEIIKDGETGLLFRGSDEADLPRKIIALLGNPTLRNFLAKNGRNSVTHRFNWKTVSQHYKSLLNRIVQ